MNPEQRKSVEIRNTDPRLARTSDNSYGIDDIGLPEDITPENAVRPAEIRPEERDEAAQESTRPVTSSQASSESKHASRAAPDTPASHDSRLERAVRKMEPTGHQISDEELRDPGSATPDSPPADNRS